jgi:hypothetical protein
MIVSAISELIDEVAMDKALDWESYNYEASKQVAILGAIEQYQNIMLNTQLSDQEKETSLVSVLAYLVLENTFLWMDMYKMKEGK